MHRTALPALCWGYPYTARGVVLDLEALLAKNTYEAYTVGRMLASAPRLPRASGLKL
jgi:hypothetical protein